jgi:hypothetical protein
LTSSQKGCLNSDWTLNLILNCGKVWLLFSNYLINSWILGKYDAFSVTEKPYLFFKVVSAPFLRREWTASWFCLAAASINGVFPHWSALLIYAPLRSSNSIKGKLFAMLAICSALYPYFLSMLWSMGNLFSSRVTISVRLFVTTALRKRYPYVCGNYTWYFECQAML